VIPVDVCFDTLTDGDAARCAELETLLFGGS